MIYAAWYTSLALEALLLLRIVRWQRRLPWFLVFLCYDTVRWLGLALIDSQFPGSGWYATAWKLSEPPGLIVLVLAAVESTAAMGEGLVASLAFTTFAMLSLDFHSAQPFFWARTAALGLACTWLVIDLVVIRWRKHAALMAWFLAVDLISYTAILTGALGDIRPGSFLVIGQTLSLVGWLLFAKDLE